MGEIHEQSPIIELNEGFRAKLAVILEDLEKKPIKELQFLPSYEIDSSVGKLYVDIATHLTGEGIFTRDVYVFLVKNENGQIIGTRTCSIYPPDSKGRSHVSGDIQIGQKGKSLAIPIDLVFMDSLQRIANSKQSQLRWEIQNVNLEKINEKKRELKIEKKMDDEAIAGNEEVKALELEQQRWQAVYGKGGKLGLIKKVKDFHPIPNTEDELDKIDSINLKRVEDPQTHVVKAEVTGIKNITDPAATLVRRHAQLKRYKKNLLI